MEDRLNVELMNVCCWSAEKPGLLLPNSYLSVSLRCYFCFQQAEKLIYKAPDSSLYPYNTSRFGVGIWESAYDQIRFSEKVKVKMLAAQYCLTL